MFDPSWNSAMHQISQGERIIEYRKRLKEHGLTDEEIKRVTDPIESFFNAPDAPPERKTDVYKDSHFRYRNDAEFKASVDMLHAFAVVNGYTPGELKQIAFVASLKTEEHRTSIIRLEKHVAGEMPIDYASQEPPDASFRSPEDPRWGKP